MINKVKNSEWSDITLGILSSSIDSGVDNVEVTITFDTGVRVFPEAPFMFVIGGSKRIPSENGFTLQDTGNREVVMCVEKKSDSKYVIKRDLLSTGRVQPKHEVNEVIYQNTMSGTLWSSISQLDRMTNNEGQISYLEELLFILFGKDTTVISLLWPEYVNKHFLVTPTKTPSKEIIITPGGIFVKNKNKPEFVKILIVAPNMETYGRSQFKLIYPPDKRKQRALVYIDINGEISIYYGEMTTKEGQEPKQIDVTSVSDLFEPLAEIYLDAETSDKVVTKERIRDLRKFSG